MDPAGLATGAAIAQGVRLAIDHVLFQPAQRRVGKKSAKARELNQRKEDMATRVDGMAAAIASALDEGLGRPERWMDSKVIGEQLQRLLDSSEMTLLVRQAIQIYVGTGDRDLERHLRGPVLVLVRVVAPLVSASQPRFSRLLASTVGAAVIEAVDDLGPLGDLVDAATEQKAVDLSASLQLTSLAALTEVLIDTEVQTGGWYTSIQAYREAVSDGHAKLPTPHWDGEPRVDSDRIYVEPRFASEEDRERSPLHNPSRGAGRTVLLGDPGNGKTSYASRLVFLLATGRLRWEDTTRVPFVVTLRTYNRKLTTAEAGLTFAEFIAIDCAETYQVRPAPGAIEFLCQAGGAFVVFDGLDEILQPARRREVVGAIEAFSVVYPHCPILVTSRSQGYGNVPLDTEKFSVSRLRPFKRPDVERYVDRWFDLDDGLPPGRRNAHKQTLTANLRTIEPRLYSNPLTLALLCNLFKADGYQELPRSRTEIYEKCSLMLYSRWDRRRGIGKDDFERTFLPVVAYLAFTMYGSPRYADGLVQESMVALVVDYLHPKRYAQIEDAERLADELVAHCVGRAWVFSTEHEDERGRAQFDFTHRTFMEYFAALHLVRGHATGRQLADVIGPWMRAGERDVICDMAFESKAKQLDDAGEEMVDHLLDMHAADGELADSRLLPRLVDLLTFNPMPQHALQRVVDVAIGSPNASSLMKGVAGWSGENGRFASRYVLDLLGRSLGEPPAWRVGVAREFAESARDREVVKGWRAIASEQVDRDKHRPWWDPTQG